MFKLSKASPETKEISETDNSRDSAFREMKRLVDFYANDADPIVKQAATALQFIIEPYKSAASRNLFEETAFIRNCLADINKPENAQRIAALPGLSALLTRLATLNDRVDVLYTQRLQALEEIKTLGKRADVRGDVDNAFIDILQAINIQHRACELSGNDPALKAALEQSAAFINALIDQLRKILARRGHSHKTTEPSEPSTPPDEATQTPDTSLPEAPDTPDQAPVATPPAINPDDLNPPAAGE
jgi:hypothetical protein